MKRRRFFIALSPFLIFTVLVFVPLNRHLSHQLPSSLSSDPSPPPPPHFTATVQLPQHLINEKQQKHLPLSSTEFVLFPDWQVFVLLPAKFSLNPAATLTCLFTDGAASPAAYLGLLPSSSRHAFSCFKPQSTQRRRAYYTPTLISPDLQTLLPPPHRPTEMIRWKRFAYDSLSTPKDLIVFAKGINSVQGHDRPASNLTCIFTVDAGTSAVASTPVASSNQEIFRCRHPSLPPTINPVLDDLRVSIKIAGADAPIPSLAAYRPPERSERRSGSRRRLLTCACTMVSGAGKFVGEWVAYHSAIGVDRFVLYDNGVSEEDIGSVGSAVRRLEREGYDVSRTYWPWPKTQEAGFSHCVESQRGRCAWIAFVDVDEFIYSPAWSDAAQPDRSMLLSLLPSEPSRVGQVSMECADFGPSGQRAHPSAGVTQGYTCRWSDKHTGKSNFSERRHKSIVRVEAVAGGRLRTVVHRFEMGAGWESRLVGPRKALVNHYKYQAWVEFRRKFKRRASAYVADWREERSMGSRDRIPVTEGKEPSWWASDQCDVRDLGLKETVNRWFVGPDGRFPWED